MDVNQLMIPVYINEKIVLDMLAIIEDGFSTVSQVSYSDHKENNCMDIFVDVLRMADIFAEKPQLNAKTQAKAQKQQQDETMKKIKSFASELKHSGTVDFILSDSAGTVVLSAQEQYLSNDNISEILGGHFKVLGKVIAICADKTESIDLLRKTTLSILPHDLLADMFSCLQNEDMKQYNLPELKTEISGPAVIVIPVAIYA